MTLPDHGPDTPIVNETRIREFGRLWKQGVIGDATFVRSLVIAGKRPDEAAVELNLLKMER